MKRLYTPFKVNKLELKNRVIMSPMSIGHTVDGFIMDDVVEFYKRRAQGGVGLIIFANMQWDKLRYNPNHGAMLTDEKYIPSLKKLTDAIHEGGSKVFAQLMHRGRCANRASIQGEQAVAPSPIQHRMALHRRVHHVDRHQQQRLYEAPGAVGADSLPRNLCRSGYRNAPFRRYHEPHHPFVHCKDFYDGPVCQPGM